MYICEEFPLEDPMTIQKMFKFDCLMWSDIIMRQFVTSAHAGHVSPDVRGRSIWAEPVSGDALHIHNKAHSIIHSNFIQA